VAVTGRTYGGNWWLRTAGRVGLLNSERSDDAMTFPYRMRTCASGGEGYFALARNDGYGADSGPSRGQPCTRALRPSEIFQSALTDNRSRPEARVPVRPGNGRKTPKSGLSGAARPERAHQRLLAVGNENEMNVVGRQAIGKRPPRRACGVGSPGDRDRARRRPRRRTRARVGCRAHVT